MNALAFVLVCRQRREQVAHCYRPLEHFEPSYPLVTEGQVFMVASLLLGLLKLLGGSMCHGWCLRYMILCMYVLYRRFCAAVVSK